MNETVYVEGKKKPLIHIVLQDNGKVESQYYGNISTICNMLGTSLVRLIIEDPSVRKHIRFCTRRVWLRTFPEVLAYWIDGWPQILIGVGVMYVMLYGFSWLMHWIGGVLF